MKRMLLILLACLLVSLSIPTAFAQDNAQELQIIIVNNSYPDTRKQMAKLKSDLPIILMDQFVKSLGNNYKINQTDNIYGINDVASTEKTDLLQLFKHSNYSVAIFAEILPIPSGTGFFLPPDNTVTVHFKILDIKNEKYLYNGKLQSTKSTVRKAMQEINIQLDKILTETLINNKST